METYFKDLKVGQRFKIVGDLKANTGMEPILQQGLILEKIPLMQNYYRTTGYKRNARLIYSTSKMNDKYFYIADDQRVEVL